MTTSAQSKDIELTSPEEPAGNVDRTAIQESCTTLPLQEDRIFQNIQPNQDENIVAEPVATGNNQIDVNLEVKSSSEPVAEPADNIQNDVNLEGKSSSDERFYTDKMDTKEVLVEENMEAPQDRRESHRPQQRQRPIESRPEESMKEDDVEALSEDPIIKENTTEDDTEILSSPIQDKDRPPLERDYEISPVLGDPHPIAEAKEDGVKFEHMNSDSVIAMRCMQEESASEVEVLHESEVKIQHQTEAVIYILEESASEVEQNEPDAKIPDQREAVIEMRSMYDEYRNAGSAQVEDLDEPDAKILDQTEAVSTSMHRENREELGSPELEVQGEQEAKIVNQKEAIEVELTEITPGGPTPGGGSSDTPGGDSAYYVGLTPGEGYTPGEGPVGYEASEEHFTRASTTYLSHHIEVEVFGDCYKCWDYKICICLCLLILVALFFVCFVLTPRPLELCLKFSFDDDDIADKVLGDEGRYELNITNPNRLGIDIYGLEINAYYGGVAEENGVINVGRTDYSIAGQDRYSTSNQKYVFTQNCTAAVPIATLYGCSMNYRAQVRFNLRSSFKGCILSFLCQNGIVFESTYTSNCPEEEWVCTEFNVFSWL